MDELPEICRNGETKTKRIIKVNEVNIEKGKELKSPFSRFKDCLWLFNLEMPTGILNLYEWLIDKTDIKNENPEWPAYKKYFMHGTSHHLGIDVHDVASIYKEFEVGMVFTVEPGIYVPEEGIGIRIEDNIVITEGGHLNLMKNIPIEADEIEALMNG